MLLKEVLRSLGLFKENYLLPKKEIEMANWTRATIRFRYTPKRDPSHHSTTQVTTQVYGRSESAALEALRDKFDSWDNFVIIDIDWKD